MTTNEHGDVVAGSIVKFPQSDERFLIGEVFTSGVCVLYNYTNNKEVGRFSLDELKDYVL